MEYKLTKERLLSPTHSILSCLAKEFGQSERRQSFLQNQFSRFCLSRTEKSALRETYT